MGFVTNPYPLIDAALLDGVSGLTGAWSLSRKLRTSYGGAFYTNSGGKVSEIFDQSGSARNVTQGTDGNRPLVATAGNLSRACADFGSDDLLNSAALMNAFLSTSVGYVAFSCIVDAYGTDSASWPSNELGWTDSNAAYGIAFRSSGPSIYFANWDGGYKTGTTGGAAAGVAQVAEWRLEGGFVSARRYPDAWSAGTATGNNNILHLGALIMGYGGTPSAINGKMFEMATFNSIPSDGDKDRIAAGLLNWIA